MAKAGVETLYTRLDDVATADQISEVLRKYKDRSEAHKKVIRVSGTKPGLIDSLKEAIGADLIPRDEVFELIRMCEENGQQHIFYYRPRTPEMRSLCERATDVAGLLLGDEWEVEFPRYERKKDQLLWADFRTGVSTKRSDWLIKLYGYEHVDKFDRKSRDRDGNLIKYYITKEAKTVCLIRWNSPNFLEVRIDSQLSNSKIIDERKKKVWKMLVNAFTEGDFVEIDLSKARREIVRSRRENQAVYQVSDVTLVDEVEGITEIHPNTQEESVDESTTRSTAVDAYIENDASELPYLVITWKPETTQGVLSDNLRVITGGKNLNEVVIQSKTSAGAVDYVTSQLRHFNQ